MLLLWTDNLSVGVKELDDGNKKLIKALNELHYAIQDGSVSGAIEKEEIEIVLHRLHNYSKCHCGLEERLLTSIAYVDLEAQKADHRELTMAVADMSRRFQNSTSVKDAAEIMRFVYDWLTNHVYVTDKKFVEDLKARSKAAEMKRREKPPPISSRVQITNNE